MTAQRRIMRVNSLLKQVISDVIRHDLKHHKLPELITITDVDTSKDLMNAKVSVSLINGNGNEKKLLINELQKCSSSIARISSKKVSLRYFPVLTFEIDNTIDEYMKIDDILRNVNKTKKFKDEEEEDQDFEDEDFEDDDEDFEDEDEDEDFEDEDEDEDEDFEDDDEDEDFEDDDDDEEYDEDEDDDFEDDDEDDDFEDDDDDEEYDEDDDEFEYDEDEK